MWPYHLLLLCETVIIFIFNEQDSFVLILNVIQALLAMIFLVLTFIQNKGNCSSKVMRMERVCFTCQTIVQFEFIFHQQSVLRVILVVWLQQALFIKLTTVDLRKEWALLNFGTQMFLFVRLMIWTDQIEQYVQMPIFFVGICHMTYGQAKEPEIPPVKEDYIEQVFSSRNNDLAVKDDLSIVFKNLKTGVLYFNCRAELNWINFKALKILKACDNNDAVKSFHRYLLEGLEQNDVLTTESAIIQKNRSSVRHLSAKGDGAAIQQLYNTAEKRIKRIQSISEKLLELRSIRRKSPNKSTSTFKALFLSFFDDNTAVSAILKKNIVRKTNKLSVSIQQPNGEVRTYQFHFCQYYDSKILPSYIVYIHDISEQEQLQKYIQQYQFQNFHFNSFSHELRTPLNCSLQLLQALEQKSGDDQNSIYIRPAIVANRLLMHQINDILDYAAFGLNSFKLNISKFDIPQVFKLLKDYYTQACELKGITLNFEIRDNLTDTIVYSDSERIMQIMVNLLNNSLKFTKKGDEITVLAQNKIKSNNILSEQYIKFIIRDTGRGIERGSLNTINLILRQTKEQDLMFQLKNLTAKYVGLGFTIGGRMSKELAMSSKQYFKVRSELNQFFKVSFRVRNAIMDQKSNTSQSLFDRRISEVSFSPEKNTFDKVQIVKLSSPNFLNHRVYGIVNRILLVDDVAFNLMSLNILLKNLGYKSDIAHDGSEAVAMVRERYENRQAQYQLVFMDIEMPIMNGYQATSQLQAFGPINVIMCSAYDSKDNIEEARLSGMKDVVTKPVRIEVLKQMIAKYLD